MCLNHVKTKEQKEGDEERDRRREREISGVNGDPPVLGIDLNIGSHIKLQLLDITLLLSACCDGLDKKCLPKRMLLQGRYGFSALWEQQPHVRLLAQELSTSSSKSSGLIKLLAYDLLGMILDFKSYMVGNQLRAACSSQITLFLTWVVWGGGGGVIKRCKCSEKILFIQIFRINLLQREEP